jgi:DNA-binding IclR family transcriptional regulator
MTGGRAARRRGIDRVVDVLECLYARNEPLRPNQIAAAVGAPRSTIYEIVERLREAGLLESFDDEGRIFLGRRLHYFGIAYVNRIDLMREAEQMLRRLTAETNETSQLCLMEDGKYVVALTRQGGHHFRISSDIGQRLPLPWTASGPLLVSHLSDSSILQLVPAADFRLPDGRHLAPEEFLRRVHAARQRGLSRLDGQLDRFTHCMAAPVLDAAGVCLATLCLVIPRLEAEARGDQLAGLLTLAAAELSRRVSGLATSERPLHAVPLRR